LRLAGLVIISALLLMGAFAGAAQAAAQPAVTAVSPSTGPAAGGTPVTITGTNMTGATVVDFGPNAATGVMINAAGTQITATSPAGTGTVDVIVTTPGGPSATVPGDHYTYIPAPTVSSVSPSSGPAAGGTSVTITGTNLTGATVVDFGPKPPTGVMVNAAGTQITATSPAGFGSVYVTVTTPGGTSATSSGELFSYVPAVTSVSPSSGPAAGGTSVTITGTGLTGVTTVAFGLSPAASITFNSDTQITATSPAGTGTVDVTVTTAGGMSSPSTADQYSYIPPPPPPPPPSPPTITNLSPASGPTAGGNAITITGTNLTGATAVRFGSKPATSYTVNGSSQIIAIAPAGSGTVDVTVTTAGETSATTTADRYTYSLQLPPVFLAKPKVLGSRRAAFSGTVNPEGLGTTAFFQYGLDLRYRGPGASGALYNESTRAQSVGSDFTNHTLSASVSGLVPNALYHIRLFAGNSAGSVDGADQTFRTAKGSPTPRPALGTTENATPVSGQVFVLVGKTFLPLTGARQIRSGAEIDALNGSLRLIAAAGGGKTQAGVFGGAIFKITQARSASAMGLTTVTLVERAFKGAPSYAACKPAARDAHAARVSRRVLQLLRASARGRFRTSGRYGAATVGGSVWSIADRCDGTLTRVTHGSVVVSDFVRRTTVAVHAGHSYLASAHK
jgi:hypothetical protein